MSEYTIDPARYAAINLEKGAHEASSGGMCAMEFASFLAHERHSDHPQCVSPVLGAFCRALNDTLPDGLRQELKGLIPATLGTAGDGLDERRGYMALDWLIRTWLPAWLELVPSCRGDARKVRELGRIVDLVSAKRAGTVVREAQKSAAAARAAAQDAAWSAAQGAVWDVARSAARAAIGVATGAAARDAAGTAAWVAARDAVRAAAGDVLALTVRELHLSAIDLFRDMIKDPR